MWAAWAARRARAESRESVKTIGRGMREEEVAEGGELRKWMWGKTRMVWAHMGWDGWGGVGGKTTY